MNASAQKTASILVLFSFLFLLLMPLNSEARFGGGHSFRSKSRSSSSSRRSSSHTSGFSYRSGGSNAAARNVIYVVPVLCLLVSSYCFSSLLRGKPLDTFFNTLGAGVGFMGFGVAALFMLDKIWVMINLVLTFGGIVLMYLYVHNQKEEEEDALIISEPNTDYYVQKVQLMEYSLEKFLLNDIAFSKVLFLDFVQKLYHQFYVLQGTAQFQHLQPFFDEKIMQAYLHQNTKNQRHLDIVIGNMRLLEISSDEKEDEFTVEIHSNYTQVVQQNTRRMMSVERWVMARQKGILSPEPAKMQAVCCPNCGASSSFNSVGECGFCKTVVYKGEKQWYVKRKTTTNTETFHTDFQKHYEAETGTSVPTLFHPQLKQQKERFCHVHGVETFEEYASFFDKNYVIPMFKEIYQAWTEKRLYKVRHLLTDSMYETQNFWVQEYQKKGYTNQLKQLNIQSIETVKIEYDAFYEAITVRIFAECFDYLTDKKGNWVAGSHTQLRHFSEYWTFIRRKEIGKENNTHKKIDLHSCPNCGADIEHIGMNAVCNSCKSKLSNGDFSYILATITQDEVYAG